MKLIGLLNLWPPFGSPTPEPLNPDVFAVDPFGSTPVAITGPFAVDPMGATPIQGTGDPFAVDPLGSTQVDL